MDCWLPCIPELLSDLRSKSSIKASTHFIPVQVLHANNSSFFGKASYSEEVYS